MSSQIVLYAGRGSGPLCAQALENQLLDLCDDRIYRISRIDLFSDFSNHSDPKSIKALFVPGGNALTMRDSNGLVELGSRVLSAVDRYGISYYGSCAGGILASSELYERFNDESFAMRTDLAYRFLSLFPGKVIAPLFPKSTVRTPFVDRVRMLNIQKVDGEQISSAHISSPGYLNASELFRTEVLATYTNRSSVKLGIAEDRLLRVMKEVSPLEIAESVYHVRSKGGCSSSILLTGSHPEISSEIVRSEQFKTAFDATKEEQRELADAMQESDVSRKSLLKGYFEKIGITCK